MSTSSETPPDTIMVSDPSLDNLQDDDHITIEAPAGGNSSVPKPKRLACMICRKRKLKCDGIKPSCSTCSRLGHTCAYDEVRRKSGPKRGYVKALEERLSASSLPCYPVRGGDPLWRSKVAGTSQLTDTNRASRDATENPRGLLHGF